MSIGNLLYNALLSFNHNLNKVSHHLKGFSDVNGQKSDVIRYFSDVDAEKSDVNAKKSD
ncbi:MAG: hypothetical protein R3267_08820 [Paenisporosarcina sp.]|nr:hypothetical protein [Paenisporosarcina sp.]